MPFYSIDPIFMEMNPRNFGQKQITIPEITKSQITIHQFYVFFHPHYENQAQ